MEAVLTYIAVATMIGVPFVVLPLIKLMYELLRHDITIELLEKWIDKLPKQVFPIASKLFIVNFAVMFIGLLVSGGDPVAFTMFACCVWLVCVYVPLVVASLLEKRRNRMKGGENMFLSGGGEVG